jgi:hypothetical protein
MRVVKILTGQRVGYVYQVSVKICCKISVPNYCFIVCKKSVMIFCKMWVPYQWLIVFKLLVKMFSNKQVPIALLPIVSQLSDEWKDLTCQLKLIRTNLSGQSMILFCIIYQLGSKRARGRFRLDRSKLF